VIDTPGIDEAGVEKLELHKMLHQTIQLSNHLLYTNEPKLIYSTSNEILREEFVAMRTQSTVLSDVFVTQADLYREAEIKEITTNVSSFLKSAEDKPYPITRIHPVAGKKKLLGELMLRFIELKNVPPSLESKDAEELRLYQDFFNFSARGISKDEKLEDYKELTVDEAKKRARKLIETSKLNEPIKAIIKTLIDNSITLACNSGLERARDSGGNITKCVGRLCDVLQGESASDNVLVAKQGKVREKVNQGAKDIERTFDNMLRDLSIKLDRSLKERHTTFITDDLPNHVKMNDNWVFASRAEAEEKVDSILAQITKSFIETLKDVWKTQEAELDKSVNELRDQCQRSIYNQLGNLQSDLKKMPPAVKKRKPTLNAEILQYKGSILNRRRDLISPVPQAAPRRGYAAVNATQSGNQVSIAYQAMVDQAKNQLNDIIKSLLVSARNELEKFFGRIKDQLVLGGFQRLAQIE